MTKRAKGPRNPMNHAEEPEQVLYAETVPVPGQPTRLEGSEAEHARRSLRLRTGDAVSMVDGRGGRYHGRIVGLDRRGLEVEVAEQERIPVWPRRTIWLGAGVLRSTRMDFIIEKASELGVARLTPLLLKRCVARPAEEGAKQERWHRLAVESLKQSKRATLLELAPPSSLEEFLGGLPPGATVWVADPAGGPPSEAAEGTPAGALALVVGPEGGLAEEERGLLARHGARFVGLGGHRLRAETAVVTLLAGALAALGELGPARPSV
jgi:16S rRNA (uracil1498-N3)-methyltransferase